MKNNPAVKEKLVQMQTQNEKESKKDDGKEDDRIMDDVWRLSNIWSPALVKKYVSALISA